MARLKALWCRRSDWIIAFRDYACRGNFTNNYAEITVRLFKEIILLRSKTYNAAALVDFICGEMEQYYKNRLLDFAHCRNNKPYLILDEKISKAGYISSAASIVVNEDGTYLVPAESDSGKMHLVNASRILFVSIWTIWSILQTCRRRFEILFEINSQLSTSFGHRSTTNGHRRGWQQGAVGSILPRNERMRFIGR